jgi:hypothetical protein
LKVINESLSAQVVRYEPEQLVDVLEMYGRKYDDGLFKIISTRTKDKLPNLSEDSYNMHKFLNDAFNNKRKVNFYLDPSLYSYAKRLAKKDLIFDVDDVSAFFWGVNKELSVYDKIKKAFYSGEDSIKFDVKTVSVATVRCYASTLSQMSGNKFRTKILNGFVTVFFKPLTDYECTKNAIIPMLSFLKTNQEKFDFLIYVAAEFKENNSNAVDQQNPLQNQILPKQEPIFTGRKLYGKPVSEEEYRAAENWQRLGFASKYNWENDIKGDVDMYPNDVRIGYEEENDDEDDF